MTNRKRPRDYEDFRNQAETQRAKKEVLYLPSYMVQGNFKMRVPRKQMRRIRVRIHFCDSDSQECPLSTVRPVTARSLVDLSLLLSKYDLYPSSLASIKIDQASAQKSGA
jgi:hypothetical protein